MSFMNISTLGDCINLPFWRSADLSTDEAWTRTQKSLSICELFTAESALGAGRQSPIKPFSQMLTYSIFPHTVEFAKTGNYATFYPSFRIGTKRTDLLFQTSLSHFSFFTILFMQLKLDVWHARNGYWTCSCSTGRFVLLRGPMWMFSCWPLSNKATLRTVSELARLHIRAVEGYPCQCATLLRTTSQVLWSIRSEPPDSSIWRLRNIAN